MKKITIEISVNDYKALERILKKVTIAMNPISTKPKKWIDKGSYLYNTVTGAKIDKHTKRRVWTLVDREDESER